MENITKESPYPDTMFYGLYHEQDRDLIERAVKACAFDFKENLERETVDYLECSIDWNDSEDVLRNIKQRKKIDQKGFERLNYKYGIAIISKEKIDMQVKCFEKFLSYERDLQPDNIHHGNLLLYKQVSKETRRTIQGVIALCCIYEENEFA